MVYSTPEFLILLALTLGAYALCPRSWRAGVLLVSSLIYYAWSGWCDTIVFFSIIVLSWLAMKRAHAAGNRRSVLIPLAITMMLAHLFFWKYLPWLGVKRWDLRIPLGISFFTLQGVAYLVDFRKGTAPPLTLRRYALFKTFFAQVLAGPIVRASELLPELENLRALDAGAIAEGAALFSLGLFKKLVLADRLGHANAMVFFNPEEFSRGSLLLGPLAFTIQIWADFSGYTDMGRGAARMFGIALPENFHAPCFAIGPQDFWRRWHSSLGRWVRDYIYIPLGGRTGSPLRSSLVLLLTMAVSGLWHGANITFLIWGLYHGTIMLLERGADRLGLGSGLGPATRALLMLPVTVFGFLLFRVASLKILWLYLRSIVSGNGELSVQVGLMATCVAVGLGIQWLEQWPGSARAWQRLGESSWRGAWAGAAVSMLLVGSIWLRGSAGATEFIYFRF